MSPLKVQSSNFILSLLITLKNAVVILPVCFVINQLDLVSS